MEVINSSKQAKQQKAEDFTLSVDALIDEPIDSLSQILRSFSAQDTSTQRRNTVDVSVDGPSTTHIFLDTVTLFGKRVRKKTERQI